LRGEGKTRVSFFQPRPHSHFHQAGWEDVAYQLRSALPYARFILPTAPTRPISLNAGYAMPGWYDIHSLDSLQGREDGPGVAASAAYINGLLEKTMAEVGIAPDRVVMAGFSQGGAMALAMLGKVPGKVRRERERGARGARVTHGFVCSTFPPILSHLSQLAGVISMSGYLPMTTNPSAPPLTTPANAATPVLFCHGDADQVVKYGFGVASADALKAAGVPVAFKTYGGMGHSACPAELSDVAAFLSERLPPV